MKVTISGSICTIEREKGDPVFSGVKNGAGESRLLYHIKRILNSRGMDLIKKRMWKDGHLVDDMQQYLRSRSRKTGVMIYNTFWAIEGADEALRRNGEVDLQVVRY